VACSPRNGSARAYARAGGAVQADHIDRQAFQDGQGGGDIGAQQHPPGGIQGHLGLDRQVLAGFFKGLLDAVMAALTSRISCEVSIKSTSTPPWISPTACSRKISASSSKLIFDSSGSSAEGSLPEGPIEPATKRGFRAWNIHLPGGGPGRRSPVDLQHPSPSPYSPSVRRLERKVSVSSTSTPLPKRSGAPVRPPEDMRSPGNRCSRYTAPRRWYKSCS
jgi:hypothetical protein